MTQMNIEVESLQLRVERNAALPSSLSTLNSQLSTALPVPLPYVPVHIRPGTRDDLPFIDRLQKLHGKQVGWMPTKSLEGKIEAGHVLVAQASGLCDETTGQRPVPLGYCIASDRYFKRDDVGIIYQMNVAPGRQRGLIGATLLKAQFERSAYGCKLYCCWCAQDLAANQFWEAMGFVPLAYRAGSEKKSRVHIFWQKRIRSADASTPWWFPAKTDAGSMREDRVVLPIPPGVKWSDEMPMIIRPAEQTAEPKQRMLAGKTSRRALPLDAPTMHGSRQFGAPCASPLPPSVVEKVKREKAPKAKADPKLIAAARELRDRWLEQVNAEPSEARAGKYEVSRAIGPDVTIEVNAPRLEGGPTRLLPAAA